MGQWMALVADPPTRWIAWSPMRQALVTPVTYLLNEGSKYHEPLVPARSMPRPASLSSPSLGESQAFSSVF